MNQAKEQKYELGDLVRIAKYLGRCKSHFPADCDAIVLYSYADEYWGTDTESYCLFLRGQGGVSWYEEGDLSLIKTKQFDTLLEWRKELRGKRICALSELISKKIEDEC